MGGESYATAGDIELVTLDNTQLYLVDEDESVLMQHGTFKLVLTKQLHSPLAALVAVVKDVEWPVGRDCPVIKLGKGCYTFYLPEILYGLALSDPVGELSMQLELFFMNYCTYEDHSEDIGGSASGFESAAREFWNNVASKAQTVSSRLSWNDIHRSYQGHQRRVRLAAPVEPGEMSPRMMKRVQQARRWSAISKLFSRALLKGAINNMKHVINTARSIKEAGARRRDEAFASVDAVAKVVEAVESAGRSIAGGNEDLSERKHEHQVETAWTLNRCGVHMLLGAVAASTAINLSRSQGHRPPLSPSSSKFTGLHDE